MSLTLVYGCTKNILLGGECHFLEAEIRSQEELDQYVAKHAETRCKGIIECAGSNWTSEFRVKNGKLEFRQLPLRTRPGEKKRPPAS